MPQTGPAYNGNDGAHDLLRLMQEGKLVIRKKGTQRLKPRKKKFSVLKKKVLDERLRRWRELHSNKDEANDKETGVSSSTVSLLGFVGPEDLDDDDEFAELCENLKEMASKVGESKRIYIPRYSESHTDPKMIPVFVDFIDPHTATAATGCWNGLVIGGNALSAQPIILDDGEAIPDDLTLWQDWCVKRQQQSTAEENGGATFTDIKLENVLTEDDFDDDECLEESVADICEMAREFGSIEQHTVYPQPTPHIILRYKCNARTALDITLKLRQKVIGGRLLVANVMTSDNHDPASQASTNHFVILENFLTDDDLEDDDCLGESLNDLRQLATQHGVVENVHCDVVKRTVRVFFDSATAAESAQKGFDGMVMGGTTIVAMLPDIGAKQPAGTTSDATQAVDKKPAQMFSGDKRIPDRFAQCKSVPKVPNPGTPRNYAVLSSNENVKPLLVEMLAELMRLQRRAVEEKNTKAKRRLVMGLREVARGIRSRKVRMVIMANNMDDYGVLDEKLEEILNLCRKEGVPVFFEFSKRGLGKAIGKSIKIAIVGIQNCDGANQQFKKLLNLAPALPSINDENGGSM